MVGTEVVGAIPVRLDPGRVVDLPTGEEARDVTALSRLPDVPSTHSAHIHVAPEADHHGMIVIDVMPGVSGHEPTHRDHVAIKEDEDLAPSGTCAGVAGPRQAEAVSRLPNHPDRRSVDLAQEQ